MASSIDKNTASLPITSMHFVTINFSITPTLGFIKIICKKLASKLLLISSKVSTPVISIDVIPATSLKNLVVNIQCHFL
nr:hypothetical protein Iba_chr02aCG18820 [Ipomoea batatas]